MTDPEAFEFLTSCRRCGQKYVVVLVPGTVPRTAQELEEARRYVALGCPKHQSVSEEEALRRLGSGDFTISPAVAAELKAILGSSPPPRRFGS